MAVLPITCGHCGSNVGAEIVADGNGSPVYQNGYVPAPDVAVFLRCPVCRDGSVRRRGSGTIVPGVRPDRPVKGLASDVARAWDEARDAHSVGAYTAAEIMCRKILMHVAVDKAGAEPGQTFAAYITALQNAGCITAGLRPVVDQVRQRGNVANHDLPGSSETEALQTITITGHLLEALYELPALIASASPPQQAAAPSVSATSVATVT